jgi:hypothetical protein
VHIGYGAAALFAAGLDDSEDSDDDVSSIDSVEGHGMMATLERRWRKWVVDLWVEPRQAAVKRTVDKWWSRYGLLVFLPAALVSLSTIQMRVLGLAD